MLVASTCVLSHLTSVLKSLRSLFVYDTPDIPTTLSADTQEIRRANEQAKAAEERIHRLASDQRNRVRQLKERLSYYED